MPLPLVLASGSIYRKRLLQQLQLDFITYNTDIDETPGADESPQTMVLRLAAEKAQAAAKIYPDHIIISSDQVAVLENEMIGKPHHFYKALRQLKRASGKSVVFYTSLCVYNAMTGKQQLDVDEYKVLFRKLNEQQIINYLKKDEPFNCAGSFKAESLGVVLFQSMQGSDPYSLIGLPLIKLTSMLNNEGISPI